MSSTTNRRLTPGLRVRAHVAPDDVLYGATGTLVAPHSHSRWKLALDAPWATYESAVTGERGVVVLRWDRFEPLDASDDDNVVQET